MPEKYSFKIGYSFPVNKFQGRPTFTNYELTIEQATKVYDEAIRNAGRQTYVNISVNNTLLLRTFKDTNTGLPQRNMPKPLQQAFNEYLENLGNK